MFWLFMSLFAGFVWWSVTRYYGKRQQRKHKPEVTHIPGEIPDWLSGKDDKGKNSNTDS